MKFVFLRNTSWHTKWGSSTIVYRRNIKDLHSNEKAALGKTSIEPQVADSMGGNFDRGEHRMKVASVYYRLYKDPFNEIMDHIQLESVLNPLSHQLQ